MANTSQSREPRRNAWLCRYTAWAIAHPLRVLGVAMLVLSCCWGLASRLQIRGDFVSLLPSESGTARRFREALERKQASASTLVVVIESPDGGANQRFIDDLAARVRKIPPPLVTAVQTGTKAERDFFHANRWLFAPERDLRLVRCELDRQLDSFRLGIDEPCETQVDDEMRGLPEEAAPPSRAGPEQRSESSEPPSEAAAVRPLSRIRSRLERELAAQDRFKSDYFRSSDGTSYALVIRSSSTGMGELSSDELLTRVRAMVEQLRPTGYHPRAKVGFTGDISNTIAERKSLIANIALVSALASTLILAVILVYFRSAWALVHIGLCAAAGCGVAFAVARLAYGHLNMASGFLGSIIAGNGINIPMIYFARYRELRSAGFDLRAAVGQAAMDCRRGTWLGAVAAAGAYFSLGVTSFRGFSEFGLIGGTGSVACWIAAFSLCPASISLIEGRRARAPVQPAAQARPLMHWLARVTQEYSLAIIAGLALLALLLAVPIARYVANPWEYDFGKLRSVSSAQSGSAYFSRKADQIFGSRGAPELMLASDPRSTLAVVRALRERDQQLFGGKLVRRVSTVYDYLGGEPAVAQRKLALLADIRGKLDRGMRRLNAEDRQIARDLRPPESLHALSQADLPPLLRERFTETSGRFGTSIFVDIDPELSRSRGESLLKIAELLEGVREPDGRIVPSASRATVFAEMIRSMTHDAPRTIVVAFLVVVFVAAVATRAAWPTLAVLSSLILAIWLTLGSAATFDVRLNFLNFVALPLTFGIGVEYAINYYDRVRAIGDVERSLESVGGAIAACSLTTMLGYGTLLVGDSLALRSFGKYAVIGELSCLSTALVMLPAGLSLIHRHRRREPRQQAFEQR